MTISYCCLLQLAHVLLLEPTASAELSLDCSQENLMLCYVSGRRLVPRLGSP